MALWFSYGFIIGSCNNRRIKSIAKVTEKLVPFMALIYVSAALIIIMINYNLIFDAFKLIINGAFTGEGGSWWFCRSTNSRL